MGAAEGAARDKPAPLGQLPGDGIDLRGLHGLVPAQRRQDAGQTLGQHGFAGAGCADQQYIVAACRRDDHGPAGEGLPHDVREIGGAVPTVSGVEGEGNRRNDGRDSAQCVHHLPRGAGRVDLHGSAARLGGFSGVFGGDVEGFDAVCRRGQRHGQHTGHWPQGPIQRQFAEEGGVGGQLLQLAGGSQHGQQQGQVVNRAGLADVSGGQIDRDVAVRPLEAQIFDGGTDAVAAFAHGGVRQTHQRKGGQPAGYIRLDRNSKAVQAVQTVAFQDRVHKISLQHSLLEAFSFFAVKKRLRFWKNLHFDRFPSCFSL